MFVVALVFVLLCESISGYHEFSSPHTHHQHLSTESFSEGPCMKPEVAKEIDFEWLMKPRTFYIPIASQFSFRRNAEVYLSRPVESPTELEDICQSIELQKEDDGHNATANGFGHEFFMKCKPEDRGVNLCKTRGGSPGTNPSKITKTEEYITATDNKHYVVIVRCVDDLYKDYQVLTTYPSVPTDVLHKVLDHIYDLGFNPRKLAYFPPTTCIPPADYYSLPKLGWPREGAQTQRTHRDFYRRPSLEQFPQHFPFYPHAPFFPF